MSSTSRSMWLVIALLCIGTVVLAHEGFQNWLHMKPCRQCVYIRFGFIVIALGALLAYLRPQSKLMRGLALGLGFLGIGYAGYASYILVQIHRAIHSDGAGALFGLPVCSLEPDYPFGLPLGQWFPSLFQPTGDCGYDLPEVPVGTILSPLQRMLITMYQEAGGWYLIPSKAWGSMAECTLVGLAIGGLWYLYITVQFLRGR